MDLRRSAFVSIRKGDELRGCLGRLDARHRLAEVIPQLAASVADSDSRFRPVSPKELESVSIEISVLTPERSTELDDIEIGRHGLIIEQGSKRGLLLPQVATERRWDRLTFLRQTCLKAGLPPDAWQHGARILSFEAQVFSEGSEG